MVLMASAVAMVMTQTLVCSVSGRVFYHKNPVTSGGFTLLEILLVLGIISLVSLLLIPNAGNIESRLFSVEVREVTDLLNHVRREAVLRGQPSTLRLIADGIDSTEMMPNLQVVATWVSEGLLLEFLDSTDRLSKVEDSLDITFYPEGGSSGGTLLLILEPQRTSIQVDPFTGRISHDSELDQAY